MRPTSSPWTLFLIVLTLSLTAHSAAAQAQRQILDFSALATEQNRDKLDDHQKEGELQISFSTNFAPKKAAVTAELIRADQSITKVTRSYEFDKTDNTLMLTKSTAAPSGSTSFFSTSMDFGIASSLNSSTTSLTVTIDASGDGESASSGPTVIQLGNVKAFYELANQRDQTIKKLIGPLSQQPTFDDFHIQGVTSSTITAVVSSPSQRPFRAQIFAYQTTDDTKTTVKESASGEGEIAVLGKSISQPVTVKKLQSGVPYIILVRELDPPSIRSPGETLHISRNNKTGEQLATSAAPKTAIVTFLETTKAPLNTNNQKVAFQIQAQNASKIRYILKKFDQTDFKPMGEAKLINLDASCADKPEITRCPVQEIAIPLTETDQYEIEVTGISGGEEASSGTTVTSLPFHGWKLKLFDSVQMDLTDQQIKLIPTSVVAEQVTTSAKAVVGDFTIAFVCTKSAPISCAVPSGFSNLVASLKPATTVADKVPAIGYTATDLTATPVPANSIRSFVRVELTIDADGGRHQSQMFEIAYTMQAKGSDGKPASVAQKFGNFAKSVLTGTSGGNSIDAKTVGSTGVGGFLAMLVRLFL